MLGVIMSVAFIAAPRTATVAFELGTLREILLGDKVGLAPYSAVYFLIVWLMVIRENKVVDYIGKYLTPTLALGLLLVIALCFVNPIGPVNPSPQVANIWGKALMSGYQTLDVAAIIIFSYLIAWDLTNKGYTTARDKFKVVLCCSAVVGVLMFLIYGGLCYMGAAGSMLYGSEVGRGQLVVALVQKVVGEAGTAILGLLATLACLTTAMALVSALSAFLERLTNGRLNYKLCVTALSIIFALAANLGLSTILAVAEPIIMILYPAILVMVALELFDKQIRNDNIFKGAVAFSLLYGILEAIANHGDIQQAFSFIEALPMQKQGLGWIAPAAAGAVIGYFIRPDSQTGASTADGQAKNESA
jgi:LIVCS family branched-chain amino acid:cation transporter